MFAHPQNVICVLRHTVLPHRMYTISNGFAVAFINFFNSGRVKPFPGFSSTTNLNLSSDLLLSHRVFHCDKRGNEPRLATAVKFLKQRQDSFFEAIQTFVKLQEFIQTSVYFFELLWIFFFFQPCTAHSLETSKRNLFHFWYAIHFAAPGLSFLVGHNY